MWTVGTKFMIEIFFFVKRIKDSINKHILNKSINSLFKAHRNICCPSFLHEKQIHAKKDIFKIINDTISLYFIQSSFRLFTLIELLLWMRRCSATLSANARYLIASINCAGAAHEQIPNY